MPKLSYVRARSVAEAVALLNEPGLKSRPLAGSTDLILQLRHQPDLCQRVVDVSLIPEMNRIERAGEWVEIGAAATFSAVIASRLVNATAPVLVQACRQVGAVQIRNMGTLGGNVANAAACADSLPALVCLDALARVAGAAGERELPVSELVVGPNRTRLAPGELLVALRYPIPQPGSRSAFLKLGRRNAMAISRLTVAALGRLDAAGRIAEARLAAGSATPHIARLQVVEDDLRGQTPAPELYRAAAGRAADEMVRQAGWRWSSEFKVPALTALVARVLTQVFAPPEDEAAPLPLALTGEPDAPPAAIPAGAGGELLALAFTLNGAPVSVNVPAETRLLDVLRDHLGLTGTKEGCGIGECGACSVLLDGRLVNACLTLAAQAAGRSVVTIEGVANPDGSPNDLQQAFIQAGAVQCGFCTPGMILAGEALLSANPRPTRPEIRAAIAGNLCRCTGYQQIVDAIQATAARRQAARGKEDSRHA